MSIDPNPHKLRLPPFELQRCFLIHGAFDPNHGRDFVDRFGPLLEARNWTPKQYDYTDSSMVWTWGTLKKLARRLANRVRKGDVAIAQCFGATIAWTAMKRFGASFERLVLINPNLDRNIPFPKGNLDNIYVWYVPGDPVLIGSAFIPFHPAGLMGHAGYRGDDTRVNVQKIEIDEGMRKHSALFDHPKIFNRYADKIVNQATGSADK